MTNIGSGLDAQFGLAEETTAVGTPETVDRFYEITDADPTLTPTYIKSDGIKAGARFRRIAQVGISKRSAGGNVSMPLTYLNQGLLWKLFLGSLGTPSLVGTTAYEQIHVPGTTTTGISATIQLGKPEPATGTVQPFTYNGCKVTDWEVAVADGEETSLKFTFDAWDEDDATALAAASYTADNGVWNFADCTVFKLGGTPSTSAGETSISGGSAVTSVVNSFTMKGAMSLATDRYGVGNAGIKKEQLEKDFVEITGDFEGEFDKSTFYDTFNAGDTIAIQLDHVGADIEASYPWLMSFIIPAAKLTDYSASVSGPDLVSAKGTFTAYDNEADPVIQVKLRTTETAI